MSDGPPSWTTRPSSTTTSRSASTIASSGSCVTRTATASNSARWRRSWARTSRRVRASSAASGSSRSSRRGRVASARARATRWAWPPDSLRGLAPAWSARPRRSSHSAACARASRLGRALAARPERHVVQGGQVREEQVVLEDDADRAGLGRRTLQRRAVQAQTAVGERGQAGEGTQGGGLPGTVRAEQGDDLAGRDAQRHVETEGAALDDEVGVEPVRTVGGPRQGLMGSVILLSSNGRAGPPAPRRTRPAGPD